MPTIAERARILQPALGRVLGVVATLCLRSAGPLSIDLLFAFYFGLMVLGAAWLRGRMLRVLIPFTHRFNLPAIHPYGANHV